MNNGEGGGNRAGNFQLNANSTVTLGLVFVVLGVAGGAIYKAGEVITDIGYVKRDLASQGSDVAEIKRIIQRLDRQQGAATNK